MNDLVLLYDSKFDKFPGKFKMHWLGPYVIKDIIDGGMVQLVKLNGDPFLGKVNGSHLKPYIDGPAISLIGRSTVLVLHEAKRRHGTINYTAWFGELRDFNTARCSEMSQGPKQHEDSFARVQVHRKVTIKVTIHDLMVSLMPNGAGGKHLR